MIKKTKSSIIGLTALAVIICVSTTITLTIENHIDNVNAEECAHEHVEYYEAGVATTDKPGYRSHYACCNCHLAWADENKTRLLGRTADYGTELADRSKIDCYDIDWRGKTSATRYDFRSAKDVTQTLTFVKGEYDASKHCGETANDKVSYSWNYNGGNGICIVTSPCLIRFKTNDTTAYDNIFNDFKKLSDFDIGNIETSSLTNMQMMFAGVVKASEIKNITVMDTSSATTMKGMFYGNNTTTSAITELDLSNFDTSNVSNFHTMFYFQNSLKTIYVSDRFITSAATEQYSSLNMFYYASSIVGGKGTTYSTEHLDKEYARIDQGPDSSAPGYFTAKE